jgi:hypothetical protein
LGPIFYFLRFNDGWSTDHSRWGEFGDFIGLFVSLANLPLIVIIAIITVNSSVRIARLQTDLSNSQLRIEQLRVTPHLYLTEERSLIFTQDSWIIRHTGEGPAINVLVRFTDSRNSPFTRWVSCLSLGSGDQRDLVWLRNADVIQVCYCDITEQSCFLYTFQDRIGRTTPISVQQYQSFLNIAIENRENTHPRLVNEYLDSAHAAYHKFYRSLL